MDARALQETSVRYFLEVVRCGSITEAAGRLNVVPSALSKQISRLEATLGTRLFERRSRGMVPTSAGELLAVYAFRNQLETERVSDEIIGLQGLHRGEVRLACTAGFSMEVAPRALVTFRQGHPGITFHLEVATMPEITRMLREAEVDVGLTFSQVPTPGLNVEDRTTTPVMAIMHRRHPLALEASLTLARLAGQALALPSPGLLSRQIFDASCSRQGLALDTVFSTGSIAAMLAFARREGGIVIGFARLWQEYMAGNGPGGGAAQGPLAGAPERRAADPLRPGPAPGGHRLPGDPQGGAAGR